MRIRREALPSLGDHGPGTRGCVRCSIDRTVTHPPNPRDRPFRKPRRPPRPGFPFGWTGFLSHGHDRRHHLGTRLAGGPAGVGLCSSVYAAITRCSYLLGGCPLLPYGMELRYGRGSALFGPVRGDLARPVLI